MGKRSTDWVRVPDDTFLRPLVEQLKSGAPKKSSSGRYLAEIFNITPERYITISESVENFFDSITQRVRQNISGILANINKSANLRIYNVPYLDEDIYKGQKILIPNHKAFTHYPEYLEQIDITQQIRDFLIKYVKEFFICTGLIVDEDTILRVLEHLEMSIDNNHGTDAKRSPFEEYINSAENQISDPLLLRTILICFSEQLAKAGEKATVIHPREKIPHLGSAERRRIIGDVLQKEAKVMEKLEEYIEQDKKLKIKGPNNEDEVETTLLNYLSIYVVAWPILSRLNLHPSRKISKDEIPRCHVLPYEYPYQIAKSAIQTVTSNDVSPEDLINKSFDPTILTTRRILIGKENH